jgi:hypothetical protein
MMDKYIFAFCVLSCIMIVFCIIGFVMDFSPKVYIGCAFGSLIFSLLASMLDRLREMAGKKAD